MVNYYINRREISQHNMEPEEKKATGGLQQFIKSCTLERLKGHTGAVTALTGMAPVEENESSFYSKKFMADGVFASGSEDGTIRIWDARVNKYLEASTTKYRSVIRISESKFLESPISSLCFHQNALSLFAASGPLVLFSVSL